MAVHIQAKDKITSWVGMLWKAALVFQCYVKVGNVPIARFFDNADMFGIKRIGQRRHLDEQVRRILEPIGRPMLFGIHAMEQFVPTGIPAPYGRERFIALYKIAKVALDLIPV